MQDYDKLSPDPLEALADTAKFTKYEDEMKEIEEFN